MAYYDFPHTRNYDQDLGYLIQKYEELEAKYGEIEVDYKTYVDEQVANALTTMRSELAETVTKLNKQYEEFKEATEETLNEFSEKLEEYELFLKQIQASMEAYTDNAIAQYDVSIKQYIASQLIDVKVVNYFTGLKVSIQEMFDYLSQFHLTNAITYTQLGSRDITYVDYRDLNMTYTQLAIDGNSLIPQK